MTINRKGDPIPQDLKKASDPFFCKILNQKIWVCRANTCRFYPCQGGI
jgi:hypothetical protein